MSPEFRNVSPRFRSAAISASEEWRSAGEGAMTGVTTGAGLSGAVELGSGGDAVAGGKLVSVFGIVCAASELVSHGSVGKYVLADRATGSRVSSTPERSG